jgi:kinesin family protein 22
MEIYNEKVYDLLNGSGSNFDSKDLPIREDQHRNISIPNLTKLEITSFDDFDSNFNIGVKNRSTAATKLNANSSRSHSIVLITFESKQLRPPFKTFHSKLHLIDLAGSEDNRRTENVGQRLKESGSINKSLFVLGQVVDALNNNSVRNH